MQMRNMHSIAHSITQRWTYLMPLANEFGKPAPVHCPTSHPAGAGIFLCPAERITVVVVDDDGVVLDVACDFLRQLGYNVFGTSTSKLAYSFLVEHKTEPMILVTDLILPGESGWTLVQATLAQIPHLPVLFMSGFIDRNTVSPALERSCISYLQKPFDLESLSKKVGGLASELHDNPEIL